MDGKISIQIIFNFSSTLQCLQIIFNFSSTLQCIQIIFNFSSTLQYILYSGKLLLVQILHIWPKSPQNKTAWWSCSRYMSLFSFCFGCMTDQSLWVGRSKVWQNTSCPYLIFTVCIEVKVHSNFRWFKFSKYAKISTRRKFPAIQ